jgi:hypothetical protein
MAASAPTSRGMDGDAGSTFLEFHHVGAHAHGGPATVENISLRCRRHNQYEAELVFGPRNRRDRVPDVERARAT